MNSHWLDRKRLVGTSDGREVLEKRKVVVANPIERKEDI